MFTTVKKQMQEAFQSLASTSVALFVTDVNRDVLWDTYLNSFANEAEKQEHNCNCCRSFIKQYGNIVGVVDGKLVSIWNFEPKDDMFTNAVKNLNDYVLSSEIRDVFMSSENKIGTDSNVKLVEGGSPIVWNHFCLTVPQGYVNKSSLSNESILGTARDNKNVLKRSLEELTRDSVEVTLELISQGSLYRGDEFKGLLTEFLKLKKEYDKATNKDLFCWINARNGGAITRIRNTSIGTLLIDLSEGKDIDKAVSAFERVVAPANYKRPTALVTKKMIEEAEKAITDLGYANSLGRRFASSEDIKVTNLLFVDRSAKKKAGIFNELKEDVKINPKSLSKVEEITIDKFLKEVLPNATAIEAMFDNSHLNNLVSVITAKDADAPNMLKWANPFSWSYTNAVTDSIKEQVKAAGGKVDGVLRFSIQWNEDGKSIVDLDAHAYEPNGTRIYYGNFKGYETPMSGMLDVDMVNPPSVGVENITWSNMSKMREGKYKFAVHNFNGRRHSGVNCQIEFNGEIHNFSYNKHFDGTIHVAEVEFSKTKGFTLIPLVASTGANIVSKDKWGISTNKFYKVSSIMNSPNFWDGQEIGNKHTFFILEGCKNDENARGIFNEFLKPELEKHKRVFEILGGKMKVEESPKQLSGLGFSSTQRNFVICKISGKFERTLKITF